MKVRSKKPGKQRLSQIKAPLHQRHKFMTAKLVPELREKLGIKRLPVRKGDVVRIMRGEWTGHEGKVVAVDYEKIALHIDGVTIRKADGTPRYYPIHPSNVMIVRLDLSDKYRRRIIERRKGRVVEIEEKEVEVKEKVSGEESTEKKQEITEEGRGEGESAASGGEE